MRKTKIVATMGPASRHPDQLRRLFEAGLNVVRINMSHSSQDEAAQLIADVRTISDRIGILLDTRGPEVRTTEVSAPVELVEGQTVRLRGDPGETTAEVIRVNYAGFARAMEPAGRILLSDGQIELEVVKEGREELLCKVVEGGTLGSKKGVNVPGVKLPMPFMSEQDEADIRFGARQHVDFVAASFVGEAEDVLRIREVLQEEGSQAAIISKIESRFALQNLAEIVAVSNGLMVARGDLGVEIPAEEVPIIQKQIIDACRDSGRTVIVATEMLESMIENSRPTRAETSDVANAIFEGTDAVMLSGETSVGAHPIDAVSTMARIARIAEAEVARRSRNLPGGARAVDVSDLICKGAWLAARELNIAAILVPTSSGTTAKRLSRFRPAVPILATTSSMAVARSLSLSFGVYAWPTRHFGRLENMVRRSCQMMVDADMLQPKDLIAVIAGVPVGRSGSTNLLTLQAVSAIVGRDTRSAEEKS